MTCSSSLKCEIFLILLIGITAGIVGAQPATSPSPCPNIFKYQYSADTGEYWGLIQVPSPPLGSTLHLTVNLTLNARLPTVS